jgi:hypothetical protein
MLTSQPGECRPGRAGQARAVGAERQAQDDGLVSAQGPDQRPLAAANGTADDELLIAGMTVFDGNETALMAVLSEWASSRGPADPIAASRTQWAKGSKAWRKVRTLG